ncbi:NIPSNAP family protein [Burkholderia cepacia]|uniref:NIPSNAP family protein n=1 Tax=Burkholderia cepacia TaxID=292 RepID=UPI002AB627A1|nr:NIPSNAP family protein [Burkholderia cepacia]
MIIEYRNYQLKPGTLQEFIKIYEAEGLHVQTSALGELIGYFYSEVGDLNRIVQVWRFASFEDRQERRARLAATPEWRALLAKIGPLIVDQRNELLTPAPFSPIR